MVAEIWASVISSFVDQLVALTNHLLTRPVKLFMLFLPNDRILRFSGTSSITLCHIKPHRDLEKTSLLITICQLHCHDVVCNSVKVAWHGKT